MRHLTQAFRLTNKTHLKKAQKNRKDKSRNQWIRRLKNDRIKKNKSNSLFFTKRTKFYKTRINHDLVCWFSTGAPLWANRWQYLQIVLAVVTGVEGVAMDISWVEIRNATQCTAVPSRQTPMTRNSCPKTSVVPTLINSHLI